MAKLPVVQCIRFDCNQIIIDVCVVKDFDEVRVKGQND